MHTITEIVSSLRELYPSLLLLEDDSISEKRYKEKQIIIFQYVNIANEKCVLKYFSLQQVSEPDKENEKSSLLEEFRCIKRLASTPHVVRAYDANELRIRGHLVGFYMTMEKFDGTLAALIKEKKHFNASEVTDFLRQMGLVLELAHYGIKQPVIHADIKPSNIGYRIIDKNVFEYALMDFDVSVTMLPNQSDDAFFTISNKGSIRGISLAYAPPEQILAFVNQSGNISNRVDIYAVGAVAMEMLTGVSPRKSNTQFYYELPFNKLTGEWVQVFGFLNHTEPKHRAKRIKDAFEPLTLPNSKAKKPFRAALVLFSLMLVATIIFILHMITKPTNQTLPIFTSQKQQEVNTDQKPQNKVNQIPPNGLSKSPSSENSQANIKPNELHLNNDKPVIPEQQSVIDQNPTSINIPSSQPEIRVENTENNTSVNTRFGSANHGQNTIVNKDVSSNTYNYITALATWGGPGGNSFWLTQNLGSTTTPLSERDVTISNSGWYFQFNTPIARTSTQSATWSFENLQGSWALNNDPCRILLGSNWRIPTVTEWENFARAPQSSGGAGRGTSKAAYSSLLKLHMPGYLSSDQGILTQHRDAGLYWSANEASSTSAYAMVIGNRNAVVRVVPKTAALSVRCIQAN